MISTSSEAFPAILAIHLLRGVPPVEALVDILTLSLFRNAIADELGCPPVGHIKELITHHLAVKGENSASWAVHVHKLLTKYKLPAPSELLTNPPSKARWKAVVKTAVHYRWTRVCREEASSKSTLQNLNLDMCCTDQIHPVKAFLPLCSATP